MKTFSEYNNIVVLTGAGISAESGLKTFRDNDGLWEGHRVEDVATPEAFAKNPELVHTFYNLRRNQLLNEAKPNAAHAALAQFEQAYSGEFLLVTQNVDNLHEQAGSKQLKHMHGELLSARCTSCSQSMAWEQNTTLQTECPNCKSIGTLRPNIVWFGEIPLHMNDIEQALSNADLFVSIGTSGVVYPAAGFVQMAKSCGARTVELNLENTHNSYFDEAYAGTATDLVSQFFI
jgi:NAD-dependent deacetylase